jgi:Mab-21 protein
MYVVHDNIEVTHPGEIYSIITDAPPVYKFEIELPQQKGRRNNSNYHAGYIKLHSLEPPKIYETSGDGNCYSTSKQSHKNDENGHVSDESGSEIGEPTIPTRPKYRDSIMIHAKPTLKTVAKKTSGFLNGKALSTNSTSSTSPTSSEYDYAYITALNTHQPLSMMKHGFLTEKKMSENLFIDSCITNVVESIYMSQNEYSTAGDFSDNCIGSDYESDFNEYKKDETEPIDDIHYSLEERQYLNSKEFLSYFINLFQDGLANEMGFSNVEVEQATWKGPVIYTSSWEIQPAIWCPWPKEASIGYDSYSNRSNMRFQWPTPAMKQKIRTRGCHVVPIGYTPKLGCNVQRELEWKVVFPEAERYLESCLTNAQAKIYMVTKALVKTFIDPQLEDRFNMFTIEHIRTHLFWECESNYTAWPDENLGESLIKFLNSFLVRVKTHNLPDYFLKNRNLFENIPERILAELHKRIYRITENPVMYLLIAFRNLKFSKDFYPKLKFRKLYSTLVVDDPMKIINPQLITSLEKNLQLKDDSDVAFGSMAAFERTERQLRQRRTKMVRFMEAEKTKKDCEITDVKRLSVESIDIKVSFIRIRQYSFFQFSLFLDKSSEELG